MTEPTPVHACPWDPVETRALFAAASNAVTALNAALRGHGEWERAWRKLAELQSAVWDAQPGIDAHFDAHTGTEG